MPARKMLLKASTSRFENYKPITLIYCLSTSLTETTTEHIGPCKRPMRQAKFEPSV